jgi:thioredoxin 1
LVCSLFLAVTVGEYFFNELFTAAGTASCLASVIGFRASSSDPTLFRTEKGDRAHSRDARIVALVSKKDSAADRDAEGCFTKSADRDSTGREKLNARVLDASRYVRIDFDYPDLDVFFLAMENSAIITLNESNFDRELTQDDKPMIVDFWAEWCGPCKMIAPLLDEIAREKAGTLKIAKVNVDDNQSLSAKYNIRAIPALLFFKNGQLRDQVIGVASKKDLLSRLEALA